MLPAPLNQRGVALFIVLSALATLAIFVGEITYTAQVNQKLAYDRLDQIKAHALAKSGLRLALLRIRAYTELKKTIGDIAKKAGADASAASAAVPKGILEKIWSEPITVPFSGDVSSLPLGARDAITKFRKDSAMEGKLYIAINAQSSKFNLNSTIASFAPATASPSPSASPNKPAGQPAAGSGETAGGAGANPSATPIGFDQTEARQLLTQQIRDTFAKKFEDDEKFRDRYRNLRPEDLTDEILGWSDLTYESQAASRSNIPFKQAPYYDISELHYLPSVDDDLYDLLSEQFTTGVANAINVNTIKEAVLAALVPQMTPDERKKFFEFRDNGGQPADPSAAAKGGAPAQANANEDNTFKTADDFYKYLSEKVAAFAGAKSKIDEFRNGLAKRGITIVTDESNFIVRVEATVQQTKRTLEAWVSLVEDAAPTTGTGTGAGTNPNGNKTPNNGNNGQIPVSDPAVGADPNQQRSNLKITQLRFL